MLKAMVVAQIILIVIIVGFSTYHLFKGNFELAFGALPFLFVYYIFVTARRKRSALTGKTDSSDD